MNATIYQAKAMRTANEDLDAQTQLVVAALGLAGEAGEVADHVKKHLGHGQELDRVKVEKELGDVLWYVARLCQCLHYDMGAVMEANIQKLQQRWPNKFDTTLPQAAGE